MNREIKFRGKRIDNGEWVYGGYHKHIKRTPCIIGGDCVKGQDIAHLIIQSGFSDWNMSKPLDCFEVDPDTVGQLTGLYDKNQKPIYAGDIVLGEDGEIGEIVWDNNYAIWRNVYRKGQSVLCLNMPFPLWQSFYAKNSTEHKSIIKVIGNIYENPELLGNQ